MLVNEVASLADVRLDNTSEHPGLRLRRGFILVQELQTQPCELLVPALETVPIVGDVGPECLIDIAAEIPQAQQVRIVFHGLSMTGCGTDSVLVPPSTCSDPRLFPVSETDGHRS